MLKIKYYQDAGHGWIAVKRNLLTELGIYDKITTFSYQRGQTVYLEEDGDADTFLSTLIEKGIEYKIITVLGRNGRWPDRSPIRSYEPFRRMGV